ncbi:MAG: trypsin-like peptidase domain-containing protein [Vicinamibacterales bacterium]
MTAPRIAAGTVLIVCGFAAGMVLTGRLRSASEAVATPPVAAEAQVAAPAPKPAPAAAASALAGLPDFSTVAGTTVPAVANISSTQVVRRPNAPFANDPFFQYFFGSPDDFFGSGRAESSLGSGVVVSADGYILTNHHVVAGESGQISARQLPEITVALSDKRELRAEIVGVDAATDLALLKVKARGLPTMPWGDSSKLKVAEWVLAIGNPFQLNQTVTLGIVSALGRRVGINAYEDFIQTDAAINPGNSGGALVNARGELIGINTAIFSQSGGYQGIGFAVPSNLARRVMNDFLKYGAVRRGTIGFVEYAPLTTQLADQLGIRADRGGVVVSRMRRNSPAFQAGLQPLDVVLAFNSQPITDGAQLQRLIQDAQIGSAATFRILRDGRTLDLKIPVQSTAAR